MAGPLTPLERVAQTIHAAHFREMGLDPIAWERLRKKDRSRWLAIAQAGVAEWELALMQIKNRRNPDDR